MTSAQIAEAVEAAVADLPSREQEVYFLVYGERLSTRQAARRLGVGQPVTQRLVNRVKLRIAEAVLAAVMEDERTETPRV